MNAPDAPSLPAQRGFAMPAEWAPHDHTWMLWPERPDNWRLHGTPAQEAFLNVARAIGRFEPVHIGVNEAGLENAQRHLRPGDNITLHPMASNDAWCRDTGPTVVTHPNGNRLGIDWQFNAWGGALGGLYTPWDDDDRVARHILDAIGIDRCRADLILEGGAFHVDGEGTLLTTEECLLNPNRNATLSQYEIEQRLRAFLGVERILWLSDGIVEDETDGHVDNMACFAHPGEVILAWTDDESDPQYARSKAALDYLSAQTDARGRRLKVHKLPLPGPLTITDQEASGVVANPGSQPRHGGDRLAASYVNFYLCNGGLIMPAFNDPMDLVAQQALQRLFPDREVVAVPSREILLGGGNIHCITQQIPRAPKG